MKSVKPDSEPQAITSFKQIGAYEVVNPTDSEGALHHKVGITQGTEEESETHRSFKFGEKFTFKQEVELHIVKLGFEQEFAFEQEFGSTDTTKHSTEVTAESELDHPAAPHGTTYYYVFQTHADLNFNYTVDLTAGLPGTAQSIRTPMARPLGISPARNHPCMGYLVAGGESAGKPGRVHGSLLALRAEADRQKLSPDSPILSQDQKAFLRGAPGFSMAASDRCPGFPAGYPSGFAYNAAASFHGRAAAGEQPISGIDWAPDLGGIVGCPYFHPFKAKRGPAPAPTGVSPCTVEPTPPHGAGSVFDAGEAPDAEVTEGDEGSNLILADSEPDGDVLRAGPGEFDILDGSEHPEALEGGPGTDVLMAEEGADELDGGAGDDTLDGGPGNDSLVDAEGNNSVSGGPGADSLETSAGALGGLLGDADDDELTMRGDASVAMLGGTGDDTYRLLGDATANTVTELPGEGVDTIVTSRRLRLPLHVERAEATGSKGVNLLGSDFEDETLVGAGGNDLLAGRVGSDAASGHGGDDEIHLEPFGLDLARGGSGADSFRVFVELSGQHGADFGRAASGHVIEDLDPGEGDRLVLPTTQFGKPLRALRDRLRVTRGGEANGNGPQLLFGSNSHLLSFDRDGRGGEAPISIAILQGHAKLPRKAIKIVTPRVR